MATASKISFIATSPRSRPGVSRYCTRTETASSSLSTSRVASCVCPVSDFIRCLTRRGFQPVHATGRYFYLSLVEILQREFGYAKAYSKGNVSALSD
jgi:hypothetical protein